MVPAEMGMLPDQSARSHEHLAQQQLGGRQLLNAGTLCKVRVTAGCRAMSHAWQALATLPAADLT